MNWLLILSAAASSGLFTENQKDMAWDNDRDPLSGYSIPRADDGGAENPDLRYFMGRFANAVEKDDLTGARYWLGVIEEEVGE